MPPPANTPTQLTDRAGVEHVFGAYGVKIRLNASRTGVVAAAEMAQLTFVLNYGSEAVYGYCGLQASIERLQASWMAYWWASVLAAHKLALFRQYAVPATLQSEYEEVLKLIYDIGRGTVKLASLPSLSGAGASIDNMRIDNRFRIKQARVETTISDGPVQISPYRREILSQFVFERDM